MPTPGNTTARGYGSSHQQLRRALLAQLKASPGQPCSRCGRPMFAEQALHLDHEDDRSGYRGLSHAWCNTSAGGKKAGRRRRSRRAWTGKTVSRW